MKRTSLTLSSIILALAVISCGNGGTSSKTSSSASEEDLDKTYAADLIKPGKQAPDFSLEGLDGKTYSLEDFKGKTVVMDFWATWCPDCRKEIDYLVSLHKKFPDVVFVGISFDTEKDTLTSFVAENGMDWVQLSEWKKWKETEISAAYNIKWIPTKYVISPKGKVLLSTVMTEKVEKYLSSLK